MILILRTRKRISHRLTFRSIVWMSDPPLFGSNPASARHPVPCSQIHIVALFLKYFFFKYLKENTWSNSLLCNSPRSLVLSCLLRRLKKEKDSIVDFLRIWWMYEWNMKAKPEKTCCEAAGRWIVDSGRLEWQHRHYRGHYQCTGVSGQDYHHHTLGYHYHS